MRPKLMLALICLLAGALWAQAPTPAAAPAAVGSKIGIINIQTAIQSTQEGKKAVADLNAQFQPKKADLQSQNSAIQAMQARLQAGGNTLSADAKAELQRTISTKQRDFQREYDDATSDFQNAENDAVNRIGTKMMQVINAYAQQHGFALILDVSSQQTPVLFATKTLDITADVIRLYDQQHPVATAAAKAPAQP